jgi:hypothetical protein
LPPSSESNNSWVFSAYLSTLKMNAICSSETSVGTQRTTRRYIPEDGTLHNHRCENLKSYYISLEHYKVLNFSCSLFMPSFNKMNDISICCRSMILIQWIVTLERYTRTMYFHESGGECEKPARVPPFSCSLNKQDIKVGHELI